MEMVLDIDETSERARLITKKQMCGEKREYIRVCLSFKKRRLGKKQSSRNHALIWIFALGPLWVAHKS